MPTGPSLATKGIICGATDIVCDSTSAIIFGEIQLEPNRWQLISLPVQFGYWDSSSHIIVNDGVTVAKVKNYIVAQIEDKYVGGGESIGDYVEVINTYVGDINAFWTWNSASPPPDSSPNNFPLVYIDGTRKEIAGIWLKSVTSINMILEWEG